MLNAEFIDLLERAYFRAQCPSFAQSYRQTARRAKYAGLFVPSQSQARRLLMKRRQTTSLSLTRRRECENDH